MAGLISAGVIKRGGRLEEHTLAPNHTAIADRFFKRATLDKFRVINLTRFNDFKAENGSKFEEMISKMPDEVPHLVLESFSDKKLHLLSMVELEKLGENEIEAGALVSQLTP